MTVRSTEGRDPAEAGAAGQRQRGGPADETQAGGCKALTQHTTFHPLGDSSALPGSLLAVVMEHGRERHLLQAYHHGTLTFGQGLQVRGCPYLRSCRTSREAWRSPYLRLLALGSGPPWLHTLMVAVIGRIRLEVLESLCENLLGMTASLSQPFRSTEMFHHWR